MKKIVVLACLMWACLACDPAPPTRVQQPTQRAASNVPAANVASSNKAVTDAMNTASDTFSKATIAGLDKDLVGQSTRIAMEGKDDAAVKKNIAEADKTITYALLKKNSEPYAGRPWICTGKILEITEKSGVTEGRLALDDWGSKVIYIAGPITSPFVEGDRVSAIGYLAGDHSYTSQAGWTITVPALAVRSMMKPGKKK